MKVLPQTLRFSMVKLLSSMGTLQPLALLRANHLVVVPSSGRHFLPSMAQHRVTDVVTLAIATRILTALPEMSPVTIASPLDIMSDSVRRKRRP